MKLRLTVVNHGVNKVVEFSHERNEIGDITAELLYLNLRKCISGLLHQ